MCDSKKEDTTETEIWSTVAGVGSEEGIDYNETGGHFSGGVTLTIW